jgi:hypothetical protein
MKILYLILIAACTNASAGILPLSAPSDATCRSISIKHKFDKLNGYPKGRIGYVVDHWCALECGGIDSVSNMVYQTIDAGKAKDKWERSKAGCGYTCNSTNSTATRKVFNCK